MGILDSFRLTDRTALVTGASRGIGRAMALALAEAGAHVIGVSKSLVPGSEVQAAVEALGRTFTSYQCDLSQRAQVHQLIADVTRQHPTIDILVNNAGQVLRKPAAEYPEDWWDQILEVNLTSQFLLARELGRRMVERRSGKIIFTASLLSFQGGITVPSYAASKGAVAQLVKALANEWSQHNVQVNAIAPGYIRTDNTIALQNDPARAEAILSRIPAARWGESCDLKGATVFLASAASDYVTGSVLTVDGGWMGR